jgi:small GTP-binding protein
MQKNANNFNLSRFQKKDSKDDFESILLDVKKNAKKELLLRGHLLQLKNISLLRYIPSSVFLLRHLTKLDLRQNLIEQIPSDIAKLENLEILLLSGNDIHELSPEIGQLKNLKELDLSNCKLKDIPDVIFQLENLMVLHLDNNAIKEIPPSIGRLQNLRVLTISSNTLKSLPPEIGQLHQLRFLNLDQNDLTGLPRDVMYLHSIKKINLNNNKFTKFPKILRQLISLRSLSISHGNFCELPEKIEHLQNLKELDIQSCKLTSLSPAIAKIRSLESLWLSQNHIKNIPIEFMELSNLQKLQINGNPLPIPPEILIGESNPKNIFDYYFSAIGGDQYYLSEVKLLFVGQGSVGKTSLVNRITQNAFSYGESKTEGISISQWKVLDKRNAKNHLEIAGVQQHKITINIWDFGGQEIMHATHRFFLTKRSLYLLVIDSRLTQEENRVEYWLKIIQSYSGTSPVLIVGNKTDQHPLDIDNTGLKRKYPNIIGILEASAATGFGIEKIKDVIIDRVNRIRHVHDLLPKTWFNVKTQLEKLGHTQNFITHDHYVELCAENKVSSERNQKKLIGFLHDLGVVLYFQEDRRLADLGILNPQWVTNGVYKILNSHTLFQNKGVLTVAMLDEILNLPEYPRGKRLFIVDMMKKFELCYDIEPDKTFLVPDLLPKDQPELKFNGIPAFEYAYPVLPSSVITRFIVRMNQKIDDGLVWRTGVLLKIGDNYALVKADIEDRKITIAIDGLDHTRRDALSAIRYQLDEIHASIKGLNPEKRVPVPGALKAEPLKYDYLLMLERAGQDTYLVQDGARLVKISVREILSGIESESQRKETGGNVTNIYIGGDVKGSNIISGNNNVVTQRIQESFNKAEAADIQVELKETLKQLADAVAVMAKELTEEQAAEVSDDLGKLVEEATKPKPNKKWYSVSIEGLIKAAENLDKLGAPVISLSKKVLSLLTGGVVQ